MASNIKFKRSAVQGKVPLASDLQLGEVALNTYDGKLFLKKYDGVTETIVEVGGGSGGGVNFTTGAGLTLTDGVLALDQSVLDTKANTDSPSFSGDTTYASGARIIFPPHGAGAIKMQSASGSRSSINMFAPPGGNRTSFTIFGSEGDTDYEWINMNAYKAAGPNIMWGQKVGGVEGDSPNDLQFSRGWGGMVASIPPDVVPTKPEHLVRKDYVDALFSGGTPSEPNDGWTTSVANGMEFLSFKKEPSGAQPDSNLSFVLQDAPSNVNNNRLSIFAQRFNEFNYFTSGLELRSFDPNGQPIPTTNNLVLSNYGDSDPGKSTGISINNMSSINLKADDIWIEKRIATSNSTVNIGQVQGSEKDTYLAIKPSVALDGNASISINTKNLGTDRHNMTITAATDAYGVESVAFDIIGLHSTGEWSQIGVDATIPIEFKHSQITRMAVDATNVKFMNVPSLVGATEVDITDDNHLVNKKFVDDIVGDIESALTAILGA